MNQNLSFQIWTEIDEIHDLGPCSRVVAAFMYLQEALDYVYAVMKRGWEKQIAVRSWYGNPFSVHVSIYEKGKLK
jgi:hypothetical protein